MTDEIRLKILKGLAVSSGFNSWASNFLFSEKDYLRAIDRDAVLKLQDQLAKQQATTLTIFRYAEKIDDEIREARGELCMLRAQIHNRDLENKRLKKNNADLLNVLATKGEDWGI